MKEEVWMRKSDGQLFEHFPTSIGANALSMIDLEIRYGMDPVNWSWLGTQGLFFFDDDAQYIPENFEILGEL